MPETWLSGMILGCWMAPRALPKTLGLIDASGAPR